MLSQVKGSLAGRFVLVAALLTTVVALAIGGVSDWLVTRNLEASNSQRLLTLASFSATELSHEIAQRSGFLTGIAKAPVVTELPRHKDLRGLSDFLRAENSVFQEIELISAAGQVELDLERVQREPFPDIFRQD